MFWFITTHPDLNIISLVRCYFHRISSHLVAWQIVRRVKFAHEPLASCCHKKMFFRVRIWQSLHNFSVIGYYWEYQFNITITYFDKGKL